MDRSSYSAGVRKKSANRRRFVNPESPGTFKSPEKQNVNSKGGSTVSDHDTAMLGSTRVLRSRVISPVHSLPRKKRQKNVAAAAVVTEGETSTDRPVPEEVLKAEDRITSFHQDFPHRGNNVAVNIEAMEKTSLIPERQMGNRQANPCLGGQNEEDLFLLLELYGKIVKKYKQCKTKKNQEMEERFERQNRKGAKHIKAINGLVEELKKENIWLKHQTEEAIIEKFRVKLLEHENAECRNKLALARAKQLDLIEELKSLQAAPLAQCTQKLSEPLENTCDNSGEAIPGERDRDTSDFVRTMMAEINTTSLPEEPRKDHNMPTQQKDAFFWQSVVESLTQLQLQVDSSSSASQLSFLHHPTGLKFKLEKALDADVSRHCEGGGELSVEMISLGTLESVAPGWMRDIVTFSMQQVHLFFDRIHAAIDLGV